MKVVTSGIPYIDIDVYGGTIAYAELLNVQGIPAIAASSAVINHSVTKQLLGLGAPFVRDYTASADDEYILIDISDPAHFDNFVNHQKIVGVIDHHPGFEDYWHEKLGDVAQIETLGAACTLVYEAWNNAGLLDKISQTSAQLLLAGILDNTLNFKAEVTTDRDKTAYQNLLPKANITDTFVAEYFSDCQQEIENNLSDSIINDLKKYPKFPAMPAVIAQLVIWDSTELLRNHRNEIETLVGQNGVEWAVNIVDIHQGYSYFLASDTAAVKLTKLAGVTFNNGLGRADRLWLRKELLKIAIAY